MALPVRPMPQNQVTEHVQMNLQGIRQPGAFSPKLPAPLYMEGTDGEPLEDPALNGQGSQGRQTIPQYVPFRGPAFTNALRPA